MSILCDKQIRQLCLVPTHHGISKHFLYTVHNGNLYDGNGTRLGNIHDTEGAIIIFKDLVVFPAEEAASWKAPAMITPFEPEQVRVRKKVIRDTTHGQDHVIGEVEEKIISYGCSSMGYDVCLAEDFRIFSNVNSSVIDPKKLDERCLVPGNLREDELGNKYVILPPNSYLLGHTRETFNIPRDIMVLAVGKSTYARSGAIVNVTPIEPGFEGTVVIEISNSTPLPLRIYANEGIAQFVFYRGKECQTSYADRSGKYNGQQGIVLPRV
jgi:dCTP deaminase